MQKQDILGVPQKPSCVLKSVICKPTLNGGQNFKRPIQKDLILEGPQKKSMCIKRLSIRSLRYKK